MFDTVRLIHRKVMPHPSVLRERGFERPFDGSGKMWTYNRKTKVGKAIPRLTWSRTISGSYLSVEVSLPKLLYGNNIQTISEDDTMRAIDALSVIVSDIIGGEFNAANANISRLDVCHNWRLTESRVYAYLTSLNCVKLPRMTRSNINNSTVQFMSKSQKVIAYAKHAETQHLLRQGKATADQVDAAKGILRVERSFLKSSSCKALAAKLGADRSVRSLLRQNTASSVISDTIRDLGLNTKVITTDSRLTMLRNAYGFGSKYQRLAGLIALCTEHGAENLVALGFNSETFRRQNKELSKAGIVLVNDSIEEGLMPLEI